MLKDDNFRRVIMAKADNLICGRKPVFGDAEQIAELKKHDAVMNGLETIRIREIELDVEFDTDYDTKCYIVCPCCGLGVNWYDGEELGDSIECAYCFTEFEFVDEFNVRVKQEGENA